MFRVNVPRDNGRIRICIHEQPKTKKCLTLLPKKQKAMAPPILA